jgi:hypothetical protein
MQIGSEMIKSLNSGASVLLACMTEISAGQQVKIILGRF